LVCSSWPLVDREVGHPAGRRYSFQLCQASHLIVSPVRPAPTRARPSERPHGNHRMTDCFDVDDRIAWIHVMWVWSSRQAGRQAMQGEEGSEGLAFETLAWHGMVCTGLGSTPSLLPPTQLGGTKIHLIPRNQDIFSTSSGCFSFPYSIISPWRHGPRAFWSFHILHTVRVGHRVGDPFSNHDPQPDLARMASLERFSETTWEHRSRPMEDPRGGPPPAPRSQYPTPAHPCGEEASVPVGLVWLPQDRDKHDRIAFDPWAF
jgi:hypothetical protein